MQCMLCRKTLDLIDPNKVTITMEPENDNRFLSRAFYVCEKCAYKIVEHFYEADPIIKKCEADEKKFSPLFASVENAETD